ncbi:hypothetical protein BDR04DRAFT_1007659, partial [Suillus decipiens]
IKFTPSFSKYLTGLVLSLCTHYIPLNQHLYCLTKVDTPDCPHCPQIEETVLHFLFECPQYQHERHVAACTLGSKSSSLSYLLADMNAIPHLAYFVNATHHLKFMLGELCMSTPQTV